MKLCKLCNVAMQPGTSYEIKDGRISSRRFDECPKCHYIKYNNDKNTQELRENITSEKRNNIKKQFT